MSSEVVMSSVNVERKRGRPRRAAAEVVAGDALIESLLSVVDGVSVEGVKVSVEDANDAKLLDSLSESVERVEMKDMDVESRLLARRERDALKKREKADAKALEKEAKVAERAAKKCERERAKALEKENANAEKVAAKAAAKAEKALEKETAKAEKVAAKAAAADEKKREREEKAAAKKAERDALKAAKAEEKKRVSDEKKAARTAKAEENKKNKNKKQRKRAAPAPELLDAVAAGAGDSESYEDEELVPQAYVVESEMVCDGAKNEAVPWDAWPVPRALLSRDTGEEVLEKTEVEMMRQPSTGYEAPVRSGDSFCDP